MASITLQLEARSSLASAPPKSAGLVAKLVGMIIDQHTQPHRLANGSHAIVSTGMTQTLELRIEREQVPQFHELMLAGVLNATYNVRHDGLVDVTVINQGPILHVRKAGGHFMHVEILSNGDVRECNPP